MIKFYKTANDFSHDLMYEVVEDGEYVGLIFREVYYAGADYHRMIEWGLDAGMEARFGENFGSGHTRVQSLMREIREAAAAKEVPL